MIHYSWLQQAKGTEHPFRPTSKDLYHSLFTNCFGAGCWSRMHQWNASSPQAVWPFLPERDILVSGAWARLPRTALQAQSPSPCCWLCLQQRPPPPPGTHSKRVPTGPSRSWQDSAQGNSQRATNVHPLSPAPSRRFCCPAPSRRFCCPTPSRLAPPPCPSEGGGGAVPFVGWGGGSSAPRACGALCLFWGD